VLLLLMFGSAAFLFVLGALRVSANVDCTALGLAVATVAVMIGLLEPRIR